MKTIKESIIGRKGSDSRDVEAFLQDHDIVMMTERKNPNKKYLYRFLTTTDETDMAAKYADKNSYGLPTLYPALYRIRPGGIIFIPITGFNPKTGFFDNSNGMMKQRYIDAHFISDIKIYRNSTHIALLII